MKAIKKLLNTKLKKAIAIVLVVFLIIWAILAFVAPGMALAIVAPFLWTLLIVSVTWLAIHFGLKAWRKRKRKEFDEGIAAKEGIEDRRREWVQWTDELDKQGIDRYELPFYLLVGEPQSGKSVLLHNSDLHFPFGQNRLSGVGGTRGCDWWFTEEAVVLDLAGRLFTHEGGAADRLEFEAFLNLLYEFRPLCPANGVILVVPCDSLLKDDEEQCVAKATKIQNALLTLTTTLQAQLPVYLVLTKGDQIFGFAESVHRLDVERRHQMFGWSRPADKIDTPFDLVEVNQGFDELVQRSRLLRAHMLAGARLPEALPEVDRMYAFPHELDGMRANLDTYLKRIFTASNITDRVFFRGMYLTSGLQNGVPIAKVCTELFGQAGDADMRDLQALFSKQRAYFIKDLIRNRVFGERGLVRPTQGRVQQTRRSATVGYGFAGALVLLSVIFAAVYLLKGTADERARIFTDAIDGAKVAVETSDVPIQDLLWRLQQINDAIELDPEAYEKAFEDPSEEFQELYREVFDARMVPLVKQLALEQVREKLSTDSIADHDELVRVCNALKTLLGDVNFYAAEREDVLGVLPNYTSGRETVEDGDELNLVQAFERRRDFGEKDGLLLKRVESEVSLLANLADLAIDQLEGCFVPGTRTQPRKELGFMLAWYGVADSQTKLKKTADLVADEQTIQLARRLAQAAQKVEEIQRELPGGKGGNPIKRPTVFLQALELSNARNDFFEFVKVNKPGSGRLETWPDMNDLYSFINDKFQGHDGGLSLSSLGGHFGSDDAGQTFFMFTESQVKMASGEFVVDVDHKPIEELNDPEGLRRVCEHALPLDPRDGGLAGLGVELQYICYTLLPSVGTGDKLFEIFAAECIQFERRFSREVTTPEEALRALQGKEAVLPTGELSVPLVQELAGIHKLLEVWGKEKTVVGTLKKALVNWRKHIEMLLYAHLKACSGAEEWIPPVTAEGGLAPEAWEMLQALSSASALTLVEPSKYPIRGTAEDVQRKAFFALAGQLENRWDARPMGDLSETKASVQELATLATEVQTRLANYEALSVGYDLEAWSKRVDSILVSRLDLLVVEVERIWEPDMKRGTFRGALGAASKELNSIQQKIDESQRAGMEDLGAILVPLEEDTPVTNWIGLPQMTVAANRLRKCRVPTSSSEVQNDPEYLIMRATVQTLVEEDAGADDFGMYLARKYVEDFADPGLGNQTSPKNAGIQLVRNTRKKIGDLMLDEVRRLYLTELEDLFQKSKYRLVFDVLFWDKDQEPLEYSDVEVRDNLNALLRPKRGDFIRLQEAYYLSGEDRPIGSLVFPDEIPLGEDDWALFHRFLTSVQAFLFAGGEKSLNDVTLSYTIRPEVGTSGSVWSLDSIDPGERRDFFWYPDGGSAEDLKSEAISASMGTRLRVPDWGFSVSRPDRKLQLLWSKMPVQSAAKTDPERYYFEVRSCLAPLLLAWSGSPTDEDDLVEWLVELTPERSKRPAPVRLEFDNPLPMRPTRP